MIRIGFIGRTKFLFDTIHLFRKQKNFEIAFIWTCKDEDSYNFKWQKFESLAKEIQCPFIYEPKINSVTIDLKADVVLSINFVNLIPIEFINKFRLGVINAHAGDLPRYRGNACPNWAILKGENEVALSIHQMDANLDSGPVIVKKFLKLTEQTYISDVYIWLEEVVPGAFLESVELLISGFKPPEQVGKVLRTFPRQAEDGKLDFAKSIEWNFRLIRASSRPFFGAFCFLNHTDVCIQIFRAEISSINYEFLAVEGQILDFSETDFSFLVAMKGGVLKITDFQVDGLPLQQAFDLVCGSMRNRLC